MRASPIARITTGYGGYRHRDSLISHENRPWYSTGMTPTTPCGDARANPNVRYRSACLANGQSACRASGFQAEISHPVIAWRSAIANGGT